MNFNWVLDAVAGQIPNYDADKTALWFDGNERLTYGELRDRTLTYAAGMRALGLEKGDRLGLLLYNDAEYIPLYLAAARLGVVPVRINFRLAPVEVAFILEDSGCKVVIVHGSLLDKVGPIREDVSTKRYIVLPDREAVLPNWAEPFETLQGTPPLDPAECPMVSAEDPITLAYTSGTTGSPKGAIWTHANTLAVGTMQALKWQFSRDTVAVVPGPIYHAGGFEALLAGALVAYGTAVNIRSGEFTIEGLLEVAHKVGATDVLLFSFMLYDLLRLPDPESRIPSSLRRLLVGGDTVMPWAFDEARRRLPEIELFQLYGLTEGGAIATTLDHAEITAQPDSIGRPLPLGNARVVAEDGSLVAAGEVGEIRVKSPAVSPGYWMRPEANAQTFVDGWCRTGDLGFVNADGYLFLAGRAKDMIRSGAENIYPAEVEKVLTAHAAVEDAALIGVADPRYHEVGYALVVLAVGVELDEDKLRAHCRASLAGYKVPKRFIAVEELPRNASGKVMKYVLRERYEIAAKES